MAKRKTKAKKWKVSKRYRFKPETSPIAKVWRELDHPEMEVDQAKAMAATVTAMADLKREHDRLVNEMLINDRIKHAASEGVRRERIAGFMTLYRMLPAGYMIGTHEITSETLRTVGALLEGQGY